MRTSTRTHMLQGLQEHCQTLSNKDNAGYRREFKGLNNVGQELTTRAGDLDINRGKNRYPYVLPYDHCRVRLSLLSSQLHSDYINASYVPGGTSERDFICTQGPLPHTQVDFWRMVWEQNVRVIVMVTACRENGRVMCEPYWPQERVTVCYGALLVTTLYQRRGPDSLITTMHLRHASSPAERRITHFHYPGWPDQGIPHNPVSMCALAEMVRDHLNSTPRIGPAIVHCSAGVGRSGTFVALLWLMQLCARGVRPNVRAVVHDLRRHRVMMVQNLQQYILVHTCLMHWLNEGMTGQKPLVIQSSKGPQAEKEKDSRHQAPHGRSRKDSGSQETSQRQSKQHGLKTDQGSTHKLHPGKFFRKLLLLPSPPQT